MSETIVCPVCLRPVYHHSSEPIVVRAVMNSRTHYGRASGMFSEIIRETRRQQEEYREVAREATFEHFISKHRLRVWLWQKGLKWTLRGRFPWTAHDSLEEIK